MLLIGLKQPFSGSKETLIQRIVNWKYGMVHGTKCNHLDDERISAKQALAWGRYSVRWGGSAEWCWARCKTCNRQIELYERPLSKDEKAKTKGNHERDVLVGDLVKDPVGDICDVAWTGTELDATEMILDSGCRRSLAGRDWHKRMQGRIKEIGLHAIKRPSKDRFRYGDGTVVEGTCSWVYPVSIRGHQGSSRLPRCPCRPRPWRAARL